MIFTEKDGRTTVYNNITSDEKLAKINPENLELEKDFIEYLSSVDRSKGTIKQYKANLHVFWCWNLEHNKNKFFVDLTKREIAKFQSYALNEWKWSPRRIRTVKATISSLSNYIENILDDEFEGYKPIVRKIESPANEAVRTKSVFQEEDLKTLLDKLVELQEYEKACAVALAMYSGKRKAELTRFKASFFNDEYLICEGALYKTPEKIKTKGRGQRGKMLDVYTLAKPFKPYLDLWMQQREKLNIKSDWLFPKHRKGKWLDEPIEISTLDSWARIFTTMMDKAYYWHSLRHWYVTSLSNQGLPDDVIKEITGWSDVSMVSVYRDRDTAETLDMYFDENGIKNVEKKTLNDL